MKKIIVRTGLAMLVGLPLLSGAVITSAKSAPNGEQPQFPVLEPYKLVRSLRMLQDQLVTGKPEAVVMLNRLLSFVSADMQRAPDAFWEKPENIYAAIIYLFNGGNPGAVRTVLSGTKDGVVPAELVKGALAYASGQNIEVVKLFSVPLAADVPVELKASIVLVTANQMAAFDAATALQRLDQVRLSSPGTLFEEAAIRRSMPIAAKLGDADKVRLLSRNYLQRFPRSPYMRDFMQQFIDAALKLNDRIDNAELVKLVGTADPVMQYSLYLQLARGALVDGQTERARFMSAKAQKFADMLKDDPSRANLYAAASGVASNEAGVALNELSQISPDRLQERDRKLLNAAKAIGSVVTRKPDADNEEAETTKLTTVPVMPVADDKLPSETVVRAQPTPSANAGWAPAPKQSEDDLQKTLEDARNKIAEIDALLGKNVQ
ncbi:chemotaxis protein [Ochrobactrum sp. MYb379]|uniref:chemotaxis protein n=1 Tax=Ochrobactrum sp. MYb379 TaxID=2745275 RepID=UPI0030B63B8B